MKGEGEEDGGRGRECEMKGDGERDRGRERE